MNLQPYHLSHEQLCDLLIATPQEGAALPDAQQEHLRDCLICASEFELIRSSIAGFNEATTTLADRELARRRPIRPPFASIYGSQPRRLITLGFVWATAALVIAAVIPLGLNQRVNPTLIPSTTVTQTAATSETQPVSDAALLDGIDQDLSAAVPTPMRPLAGPATETASESSPGDTQNQN